LAQNYTTNEKIQGIFSEVQYKKLHCSRAHSISYQELEDSQAKLDTILTSSENFGDLWGKEEREEEDNHDNR
jgi:hypothetical protein